MANVITLDLNFQGNPGVIASYILPHSNGLVMIESGPGSTVPAMRSALAGAGYLPDDVTDLFVTHIHLDHAGAAGWLAQHGALVHVHHRGLPHLENPARLLASAARIYGDQMDVLWGEMRPVPAGQLHALYDQDEIRVNGIVIKAHDTPGHATHHMSYVIDDICFSGDVGGIRLSGPRHLLMPMVPPEFHLELWRASWEKLAGLDMAKIAPTHFGIQENAAEHLALLEATLKDTEDWISRVLPGIDLETLETKITEWMAARAHRHGLTAEEHQKYETTNSSLSSAAGVFRYWRKYR